MTRQLIWLGLFLRLLVAFWNGYFGPSFGAGGDALGFHEIGVSFAETLRPDPFHFGALYGYALGVVYYLTTPSMFLGGVLSCLAWFASARILVRMMRVLGFSRRQQRWTMAVYALLPTSILWTGVTMREAYQLLLVNLAVYASLRIYLHRSRRHWLHLIVAVGAGGVLQPGLLAYGVVLVAATAFWLLLRRRRGIPLAKLLWIGPTAAVIFVAGFWLFRDTYNFGLDAGLAEAIESYQRGGLSIDARTHYKTDVSIDGLSGLLLFLPVALFQYLFEPMPWRPLAAVDLLPLAENALRALLLWKAFAALRRLPPPKRRTLLLVGVVYLSLETIFAVGTVNWGTAMRHHIPGMGLLLLMALAAGRRLRRRAGAPHPPLPGNVPAAA